jgi:hypothetical protein
VLSTDEIRRLWHACDGLPKPYAAAMRLLVLTGTRLNEVSRLRRDELNLDGASWTLPGTRTKNHRAHTTPLSPLAREVIASVPPVEGSAHVLAMTGAARGLSGWSVVKRKLDKALAIPPWILHDLRRTTVTGMAELGVAPHVIELCVNHVSGFKNGIAGVYNKSELLPERRQALERWARFVALVIDGILYVAHENFLARGDDKARAKNREVFKTAIGEGDERWDRYLATITAGDEANVVPMPMRGRP